MKEHNDGQCLEYDPKKRYTDEELKELVSSFVNITTLHELDLESRDRVLANIKEVTASSNRQLSRVLNIGRGILDKLSKIDGKQNVLMAPSWHPLTIPYVEE